MEEPMTRPLRASPLMLALALCTAAAQATPAAGTAAPTQVGTAEVAGAAGAAGADTVQRAGELASALVAKMTTDEKLEQLLNAAPAIPRLGVPHYNWWTE